MNGWVASSGSQRGAAHARRAQPSEDSHRIGTFGSSAIVALADGHGSERCVRARVGADFATQALFDVLSTEPSVPSNELANCVLSGWRSAVDADVAANPPVGNIVATEARRLLYGTTAIGVALGDNVLRVLQIGDGDVVIGERGIERAIRHVAPAVPGPGGETFSMCDVDAAAHFGVAEYDLRRIDVVLAATDGFGSAFGDPDWHDAMLADLRSRLSAMSVDDFDDAVARWCSAPAETGGDDTTIAVLARIETFASQSQEET